MKPETINKLVNEAIDEGKDPGEWVVNIVQQEQNIKLRIANRNNDKRYLTKKHKEQIKEIDQEILEVQKTCPHIEVTHYNDPSGGTAGYHECDWCNKEF